MKQENQTTQPVSSDTAGITITDEDVQKMDAVMDALSTGSSIGDVVGITPEQLEVLYTVAYGAYQSKNYTDAETLFQALCLYQHLEERFWMGLAGSRQALENYKGAIEAYEMAGLASSLGDPTPFLYAGICFLKLGDKESARVAFLSTEALCHEGNRAHDLVKERAKAMLEILSGGVKQ